MPCTFLFTLAMPKLAGEDAQNLYWPQPLDALKFPGWSGLLNYKVLACLVMAAMVTLYVVFH